MRPQRGGALLPALILLRIHERFVVFNRQRLREQEALRLFAARFAQKICLSGRFYALAYHMEAKPVDCSYDALQEEGLALVFGQEFRHPLENVEIELFDKPCRFAQGNELMGASSLPSSVLQ